MDMRLHVFESYLLGMSDTFNEGSHIQFTTSVLGPGKWWCYGVLGVSCMLPFVASPSCAYNGLSSHVSPSLRFPWGLIYLLHLTLQMAPKRARTTAQPGSGSVEREVTLSDLSPDVAAIFTSRGWESLLIGGSSFRVFLRGQTLRISPDVISCSIYVPRVIHPVYSYLLVDSIPTNSLVRSTLFNSPLGDFVAHWVYKSVIRLPHFFPTYGQGEVSFCFTHGDSIDLPTFICQHILRTFRTSGHRIGLPYACLIHRLVTSLGPSFPDGVSRRVLRPIGHTTIFQSRSHVTSFASASASASASAPAKPVDPTVPADPLGDLLADLSAIPSPPSEVHPSTSDIPSSSTSIPPPDQLTPATVPVDPTIALIGQMSILIEQQAHMMADITQLRVASEHHTVEFATLREAITLVQRGIRWMREHWDYESDAQDSEDGDVGDDGPA
ncbi:uncharacterized protein LOC111390401 [Olea europaea var. sylvestris]|uniref:uncharacterized protein LOC111390401 n=1 Tax=Olea europaea var. sylvestris TaxID=158386 RepID=UPI000C1D86FE|nr:uncharacterized protein LOC111390401 [Olea europaea var. sylvestris]